MAGKTYQALCALCALAWKRLGSGFRPEKSFNISER
jgi:hypothetical protein